MKLRTEVVEMTPKMASAIIATNGGNRALGRNRVQQLAGAMARGEFMGLNGETIKLDRAGHLKDGQHRLAAIVQSGITQTVLVVHGVPNGAQETIDIGRTRTFSDALKIRGESFHTNLAAAVRMIWAYEKSGVPSTHIQVIQPTIQELLATLDRHPLLRESYGAGGHTKSILVLSRSQVMGLHYLFASGDLEDADQFFVSLTTGDDLELGNPIFALRDRFIRALTKTDKMRDLVKLAFTVRAFNAWCEGEELTKFQWKPGGARPDRFPAIHGCSIARIED